MAIGWGGHKGVGPAQADIVSATRDLLRTTNAEHGLGA